MSDFLTNYNSVRTDSGLSAEVINGAIKQTEKIEKVKTAKEMNELGKDAFLRLLVAQMEHQDPLQPQSNTEWVSQLATYSTLEEMKNMGNTITNSQAFGMIGQTVILGSKDAEGEAMTISGVVDFVSIKSNKAYVSIAGNMYPAEDVQSILNPRYLNESVLPQVEKKVLSLSKEKPGDLGFRVSLGGQIGKADGISISVNGKAIEPQHFKLDEQGNVRLSWVPFKDLEKGSYPITIRFNNDLKTVDKTSLILNVVEKEEAKPEVKPEVKPEEKPETKVEEKSETKVEEKSETKPETKAEEKSEIKPEVKPEEKPETKPVS